MPCATGSSVPSWSSREARVEVVKFRNWYCPEHGFLVETSTRALVTCGHSIKKGVHVRRCNKRAVDFNTYKAKKEKA